jgi:hypothetical protein
MSLPFLEQTGHDNYRFVQPEVESSEEARDALMYASQVAVAGCVYHNCNSSIEWCLQTPYVNPIQAGRNLVRAADHGGNPSTISVTFG